MLSAKAETTLAILRERERERERNRVLKRGFVLAWHFCCKCVCKALLYPLCFLCVLDFCADSLRNCVLPYGFARKDKETLAKSSASGIIAYKFYVRLNAICKI